MKNLILLMCLLWCSVPRLHAQVKLPAGEPMPVIFSELAQKEKTSPPPAKQALNAAEEWEEDDELESIRRKKRKKTVAPGQYRRQYIPQREEAQPKGIYREQSPIPSGSFNALDDNGLTIPPDVHGVAGPNHLMVALNSEFRIMTKTGTVVSTVSATGFWAGVTPGGFADPHVLFDHYTNRWILVGQSDASNSALLVAVSQTADPTGTWNRYAVDVDATDKLWFDFPLVGFNQNWLVITGNMFNTDNNAWSGKSQIYIFDKTSLNSGAALAFGTNAQVITTAGTDYAYSMSPATNYGAGNSLFLLESWDDQNGQLRLSRLRGSIPNVFWTVSTATFPTNGAQNWRWAPNPGGDFAPQKGDTRKIAVNDDRMNNVVMRNGKLWAAHHVFLPGGSATTRGAIQWWVIDTLTDMPLQIGLIDDPAGKITRTFPSVAVDATENMVVGYSIFSADAYASAAYSFRNLCTPPNTMQSEVIYKEGLAPYFKNFGSSRCRWGDYSNTCLDPVTGKFWTIQEYAAPRVGSGDNASRWGTWWAEVAPEAANAVFFGSLLGTVTEETAQLADCRGYKDYTLHLGVFCAATGNATLQFSTGGTAVAGRDFELIPSSVSFGPGDNAKTITLRVYNDDEVEAAETISLAYTITGNGVVAGAAGQTQTVYLTDNDKGPVAGGNLTATIGDGSSQLSSSSFFQGNYTRARYQYLVLASELQAKGLSAGTIQGLSFNIAQRGTTGSYTYHGLTISLAATSATSVNPPISSGFSQVYQGNYTVTATGLQSFNFSTPFAWDGTSNVVVQVCFDNEGQPAGTGAEVLSGVPSVPGVASATVLVRNSAASPTTAGCSASFTNVSGFRPDISFIASATGTPVASALNTSYTTYLGPNADVYVYSATGDIIARIKNNSSFDYGCTQVTVDRAGTGSAPFWNEATPNYLASKTVRVIPTNNNPAGNYTITLYYTGAEVNGWQSATGQTWGQAKLVKTPNGINEVTPATPTTGVVVNAGSVPAVFGQHFSITGTFSSGFSGFGVGDPGGSVLPVILVDFTGQKKDNAVELTWHTAFEYRNDYFVVERSRNGLAYTPLGTVAGRGYSTSGQAYRFTDKLPLKGTNYYRLKQVDLDKKSSHSKTIALMFTAKGQAVMVYPNPATDKLTLYFALPQANVSLRILSADGRLVRTQNLGAAAAVKDVQVSMLARGSYVLELRMGTEKQSVTFIKE